MRSVFRINLEKETALQLKALWKDVNDPCINHKLLVKHGIAYATNRWVMKFFDTELQDGFYELEFFKSNTFLAEKLDENEHSVLDISRVKVDALEAVDKEVTCTSSEISVITGLSINPNFLVEVLRLDSNEEYTIKWKDDKAPLCVGDDFIVMPRGVKERRITVLKEELAGENK